MRNTYLLESIDGDYLLNTPTQYKIGEKAFFRGHMLTVIGIFPSNTLRNCDLSLI